MTNQIYKSAMGKTIDMGSLMLQNENTRAVGNMGVNARGDLLDSSNTTIEQKNQTVRRQYQKQTAPAPKTEVHTSGRAVKKSANVQCDESPVVENFLPVTTTAEEPTTVVETSVETQESVVNDPELNKPGLAGAMARSRLVKQEREKSMREMMQDKGVRKI